MNPQELTFTMKDVGWLISQLIVLATVLWKGGVYVNKIKQKTIDNEKSYMAQFKLLNRSLEQEREDRLSAEKTNAENLLNAKNSRKGIRREAEESSEKKLAIANSRIDIVKKDLKEQAESNKQEFKEINEKLNSVSGDTSEIKGMLTTFLSKQ